MGILDPFFDVVQAEPMKSRYFLGFRMKSPGADLVLFRHEGEGADGQPRGNGFLFHYAGYNGQSSDPPRLMAVNNIRNTFLFEVTKPEYQAVEAQIDMMRLNGHANPYYFSRSLAPLDNYERRGIAPMDFNGSSKPLIDEEMPDYFMRSPDGLPMVAINCVYLALQTMQHVGGVNLSEIDPDLPSALRGDDLLKVFDSLKQKLETGAMPPTLSRVCMAFSETGELAGRYVPNAKSGNEVSVIALTPEIA